MQLSHHEIENIVRTVIDRLRHVSISDATASAVSPKPAAELVAHEPAIATNTLRLEGQVVSLDSVRGKLHDIRVVEVPSKAVVTPALADELRQRKIQLLRRAAQAASSKLTPNVIPTDASREQALQTLRDNMAASLPSVWVSREPFASLIEAAQLPNARAVTLRSITELPLAIEQANPNVIVVDGFTWNATAAEGLARRWMKGTGR